MAFMMAYTGFRRAQGEPMDDMLSRFDVVARRANQEAGYTMSTMATASFLIKIIGIGPKLLVDLLRPFNNQLPSTAVEFEEFKTAIRRNHHILEHEPMNIGHAMQDGHGKDVARMTANYADPNGGYDSVGVYTVGMLHTMERGHGCTYTVCS